MKRHLSIAVCAAYAVLALILLYFTIRIGALLFDLLITLVLLGCGLLLFVSLGRPGGGGLRIRKAQPAAPVPIMSDDDMETIRNYALTSEGRDQAIRVYRRNIPIVGARGNNVMKFMSEVDTPSPDLIQRSYYRDLIKRGDWDS